MVYFGFKVLTTCKKYLVVKFSCLLKDKSTGNAFSVWKDMEDPVIENKKITFCFKCLFFQDVQNDIFFQYITG